jgi:hypothetical protein
VVPARAGKQSLQRSLRFYQSGSSEVSPCKFNFYFNTKDISRSLATVCFDNNNVTLARQILDQIVVNNDSKYDPGVQGLLLKLALYDEKDVYCKWFRHFRV